MIRRSSALLCAVLTAALVTAPAAAAGTDLPGSSAQDSAIQRAELARTRLGDRFGGAWLDHGGRLTVAITAGPAPRIGFAVATVPARHSLSTLEGIVDEVSAPAVPGIEAAVVVERNVVEITVPAGVSPTPAQRHLLDTTRARHGNAVWITTRTVRNEPQACTSQNACDPPLRSGLAIYTGGARCTSAFPATGGGRQYLMTAGHCTEIGVTWTARTASHGSRTIGPRGRYHFGTNGDMGVISVSDTAFWRPAPLVYRENRITGSGTALVGATVCKTGSTTGYTCGRVTRTNATVSYPSRTLRGMTITNVCSRSGDSGSGVWYGTTAFGILSGGPGGSGCGMIYQPVQPAERYLGVTVLAGTP